MTLNEIISIEPQIRSILFEAERHRGCGCWTKGPWCGGPMRG